MLNKCPIIIWKYERKFSHTRVVSVWKRRMQLKLNEAKQRQSFYYLFKWKVGQSIRQWQGRQCGGWIGGKQGWREKVKSRRDGEVDLKSSRLEVDQILQQGEFMLLPRWERSTQHQLALGSITKIKDLEGNRGIWTTKVIAINVLPFHWGWSLNISLVHFIKSQMAALMEARDPLGHWQGWNSHFLRPQPPSLSILSKGISVKLETNPNLVNQG